jgi:hypothetical protein
MIKMLQKAMRRILGVQTSEEKTQDLIRRMEKIKLFTEDMPDQADVARMKRENEERRKASTSRSGLTPEIIATMEKNVVMRSRKRKDLELTDSKYQVTLKESVESCVKRMKEVMGEEEYAKALALYSGLLKKKAINADSGIIHVDLRLDDFSYETAFEQKIIQEYLETVVDFRNYMFEHMAWYLDDALGIADHDLSLDGLKTEISFCGEPCPAPQLDTKMNKKVTRRE